MHEQAFTITIKPTEASQLYLLEYEFSSGSLSKHHYKRYEIQKRGKRISCPNDAYPDLPVHLRREAYAREIAAKENGTHGQDMCRAQMEARGDDQG